MTSINVGNLEHELKLHPDRDFVNYLLSGLKEGFDTGIKSIPQSPFICKNLNSALNDMDAVDLFLKKDVDKGFVIGPFDFPLFF